jgi:raffinose/stachyose/melibiose transport system permease protein
MSDKKWAVFFIIPSLAFLMIFYYYPAFSAIQHSFFEWDGVNEKFNGVANFIRMFKDEWFIGSLGNIVILTILRLVVSLVAPLFAAVLIFRMTSEKARYVYRVLFVIPMVVTFIVLIVVWQFMFESNNGLINQLLKALGLAALRRNWLGTYATALYAITFVGAPWVTSFNYGLYFLVFSAGLDNVPPTLHDAAKIDGANTFALFRKVDLPMIRGQVKMVVILHIVNSIQYFVPVLIMTQGGPGTATMLPGLVMYYNGFRFSNMGYASAIGLVLAVIIFILSWINMRYLKEGVQV